jgi:hypothetical protein
LSGLALASAIALVVPLGSAVASFSGNQRPANAIAWNETRRGAWVDVHVHDSDSSTVYSIGAWQDLYNGVATDGERAGVVGGAFARVHHCYYDEDGRRTCDPDTVWRGDAELATSGATNTFDQGPGMQSAVYHGDLFDGEGHFCHADVNWTAIPGEGGLPQAPIKAPDTSVSRSVEQSAFANATATFSTTCFVDGQNQPFDDAQIWTNQESSGPIG